VPQQILTIEEILDAMFGDARFPSVERQLDALLSDERFGRQITVTLDRALGIDEGAELDDRLRRALLGAAGQALGERAAEPVTNILANDDFVAGVGNLLTARLATEDFATQIAVPIGAYLNKQLPELVEAAMPETPEKAASLRAEEAERTRAAGERADRKAAAARDREAVKVADERAQAKAVSREQRAALTAVPVAADPAAPTDAEAAALETHREPVDLTKVKRGSLLLDDGAHLSIDYSRGVVTSELQAMDGNALLLKAPAIAIGAGMSETFRIEAVMLVLECEQGHRVLRCPMQSPLIVGGGATAQLGAESLLFRPI
jgi:hypothetical protein